MCIVLHITTVNCFHLGLASGGDSGDGTNSFNIDLHTGDSQNAISNNEDSKDSLGTNTIVSKDDQANQNSSNNKVSVSI